MLAWLTSEEIEEVEERVRQYHNQTVEQYLNHRALVFGRSVLGSGAKHA